MDQTGALRARRLPSSWLAGALGVAVWLGAGSARAGQDDVVLLPTVVPIAASPTQLPELRRPEPEDESSLAQWARRLDAIVTEAAQDLGLTLDVSERSKADARSLTEDGLVERAEGRWVVSPRLEFDGERIRVRIVAVAPGAKVLLVRTQEVSARDLPMRALVMMRDVVQTGRGSPEKPSPDGDRPEPAGHPPVVAARSQGRAVLALNAAAFGGYVGFSLQRASGSDDARLTYPLIALGTGIGLGGSMIVADEWDVGLGDAWFLSAGAWWPAAAGVLLADGYDVQPESDRYVYGLVGAAGGVTLATAALSVKGMGEGGATVAHSGGAFGLLLGGMSELAVEGRTDITPSRGMGYGAGAGVVLAGVAATQLTVAPSRVLMIDLGAVLGGLTGAAAASPLVFADEHTETKDRIWLGCIAAGTLAGGVVSFFITQPSAKKAEEPGRAVALPYGGVIGESIGSDGRTHPVYGGGVQGTW